MTTSRSAQAFEEEFVPLAEAGELVANEEIHDGLAAAPDAVLRADARA
jgi:NADPH-dependent curcumin reductase CurA